MATQEPDALDDSADVLAVLRALVAQLQGSGYRDRFGHPVELNKAYREALALLELHGIAP